MTVARNNWAPACNLRHRSGLQTSPASGCDRAPGGGTVTMGDRRARRRQDGDGGSLWSKMRGLHAFGMLQGNEKTIDDEVFQILPHKRSEEDIDKMVRETRHLSGIGTLPAPERCPPRPNFRQASARLASGPDAGSAPKIRTWPQYRHLRWLSSPGSDTTSRRAHHACPSARRRPSLALSLST